MLNLKFSVITGVHQEVAAGQNVANLAESNE